MRIKILISGLLLAPLALSAQGESDATRDSILAVATQLFDGMRSHDSTKIASTFADGAMMSGVPREGAPVTFRPVSGFIAQAGRPGIPWDEKIYDPVVQVDGDLASLWVFYTFHAGDQFSHCGYDNFQLTRISGEWKISFLADTRRKDDCGIEGRVEVK